MASVKAGRFQNPAGGSPISITGLGFQPKFVLVLSQSVSVEDGTNVGCMLAVNMFRDVGATNSEKRVGAYFTTNRSTFANQEFTDTATRDGETITEIEALVNGTASSVNFFDLTSMDVDGFTLSATFALVATWHYYIAIGGEDVVAHPFQSQNWPTSVSTQSITGASETPTLAFFLTSNPDDAGFSFGWTDGTDHACIALQTRDNVATGSVHKFESSAHCLAVLNATTGALEAKATAAFTAGGVDVSWNPAFGSGLNYRVAMLSGVAAQALSFLQKTTAGTDSLASLTVRPQAVLTMNFGDVETGAEIAGLRCSMGVADDSINSCNWNGDENGTTSDATRRNLRKTSSTKAIIVAAPASNTTATTLAEATFENFGAASLDVVWSSSDGVARSMLALAIGSPPQTIDNGLTVDWTLRRFLIETLNRKATTNGVDTLTVDIHSRLSAPYRPNLDDEIYFKRNDVVLFGGWIQTKREHGLQGRGMTRPLDDIVVSVEARDFSEVARRKYITAEIPAGSLLSVLTVIAPYFTEYGIALDPTQEVGPQLEAFSFNSRLGMDALNEISRQSGYIYEFDYDPGKLWRMVLPGSTAAPFDVTDGSECDGDIQVEPTRNQFANRIIMEAPSSDSFDQVDQRTGDGVTNLFELTNYMYGPYPYFIDGVVGYGVVETPWQPGGTESISGVSGPGIWQYDPTVFPPTVTRTLGAPPAGQQFTIRYQTQLPPTVTVEDAASIAERGVRELKIKASPDTLTLAQLYAQAYAHLAIHLLEPQIVKYKTYLPGLRPGMTQHITVVERDIDNDFIITDVTLRNNFGNELIYDVVAVEGSSYQGGWRDWYLVLFGETPGLTGAALPARIGIGIGEDLALHLGEVAHVSVPVVVVTASDSLKIGETETAAVAIPFNAADSVSVAATEVGYDEVAGTDVTLWEYWKGAGNYAAALTGGASNTKGSYVELSAATSFASSLQISVLMGQQTLTKVYVDFAYGAGGAETVFLSNVFSSTGQDASGAAGCRVESNFDLASGVRLAARNQSSAFNGTVDAGILIANRPAGGYTAQYTYGAAGLSAGTTVDAGGSANTYGAYAQVTASTSAAHTRLTIATSIITNSTPAFYQWQLAIATGAGGSETVIIPDIPFGCSDIGGDMMLPNTLRFDVSIGSSTRLSAKAMCSGTDATDRLFDVMLYGSK